MSHCFCKLSSSSEVNHQHQRQRLQVLKHHSLSSFDLPVKPWWETNKRAAAQVLTQTPSGAAVPPGCHLYPIALISNSSVAVDAGSSCIRCFLPWRVTVKKTTATEGWSLCPALLQNQEVLIYMKLNITRQRGLDREALLLHWPPASSGPSLAMLPGFLLLLLLTGKLAPTLGVQVCSDKPQERGNNMQMTR